MKAKLRQETYTVKKQVLMDLKSFILEQNPDYVGTRFTEWNEGEKSPCNWPGISCDPTGTHVIEIDLSNTLISGRLFYNFSALPELSHLNLSKNKILGPIPNDFGKCRNLRYLNLSHNIIQGEFDLTGLEQLEILDLSQNRIQGEFDLTGLEQLEILDLSQNRIQGDFRKMLPKRGCRRLVVLKAAWNTITGSIGDLFDLCRTLKFVDLSSNNFSGNLSFPFGKTLHEFIVSGNSLGGKVPKSIFSENCSLQVLDLSENFFDGEFPNEISNCKNLVALSLSRNRFSGQIPSGIGSLLNLQSLLLDDNNFSRDIPEALVQMRNLSLLDLSRNGFGKEIQEIFGRLNHVKHLHLAGNSYTGGLYSSGILNLLSISAIDLSDISFSGPLPTEISRMSSLRILILSNNQFTGNIPSEYGNLSELQILDVSYNNLSGSIPPSFGKLGSLLLLMLATNSISGEIPLELGNCSSLLWLNLANNQLSGRIPSQVFSIGTNPTPIFERNRIEQSTTRFYGCRALKRWNPADDSPFAFFMMSATQRCQRHWDLLLEGRSLYPACSSGTNQTSGYVQLSGNRLSGELPPEISNMQNFGVLFLGSNGFYGEFPVEIGKLNLLVVNISRNMFSGEIPEEVGFLKCLQNLDLSYNDFSGDLPIRSMSNLFQLAKFNMSYNPYVSGRITFRGQLATFVESSFYGDPLIILPFQTENETPRTGPFVPIEVNDKQKGVEVDFLFMFLVSYPPFFILSFLYCLFFGSERLSALRIKKKHKQRRITLIG